jgi:release factor glutamine methyltransferase
VENPRLDAELLMAFAVGVPRERLITGTIAIDDDLREQYAKLIDQRAARMPLAYIVGRREFYSLNLEVTPEVLIPRPETETLVAAALSSIKERPASRVIDLGTGSGAIALAIATIAPHARIVASDVSVDAIVVATRNALRLGVATRIEFRHADCWTLIDGDDPLGRFDLIISNPPYIRDAEIATLAKEIRDYEPRVALAGGPDGLDFYRRIASEASIHLTSGGALMVEVGAGQAIEVAAICRTAGLGEVTTINDLAGIPRVVVARS